MKPWDVNNPDREASISLHTPNPMLNRLPAILAATAMVLAAWTPDARALHPVPFPHQHAEEAAPRPPEARPRREPVRTHMDRTFSVGFGLTSALSMPSDAPLASGLKPGGGMNLFLGWRLSNWAAVDLEWFTTFHATSFPAPTSTAEGTDKEEEPVPDIENAMLSSFSGLVRIYFLNPGFFEPYVIVGASFFVLTRGLNSTDGLPGLGFCTGLGAAFNVNETIGIGARVLYRGAFFDNTEYPIPLPGAPEQSAFMNLVVISAHVRLNF